MSSFMVVDEALSTIIWQVLKWSLLASFLWYGNKIIQRVIFTYRIRHRYLDLPSAPRHWLFGNLANVGERLSPSINHHPDYAFEEVWNELGQPPAYVIDLAPIDRATLVIADPRIAEAITQPSAEYKYSTPKSNTLQAMTRLVGDHSLVLIEGDEWKTQRRRFNKGFAPTHLNTLVPLVVDKTRIFLGRLKEYASDGRTFALKDPASDLTTDVITHVAIEKDFQAQTVPEGQGPKSAFGILTAIKIMSSLTEKVGQGFDLAAYFHPQRRIKEWIFDRLYTRAIYNEIISTLQPARNEKTDKRSSEDTSTVSSAKAIIHLALSGLDPSPSVLNAAVSQVKTFLFAGQDTTSTVIQWMAWELSKANPSSPLYSEHSKHILQTLCAEHIAVFGSTDPFAPLDIFSNPKTNVDEMLGSKLPYTTAFVKETLRLHPPAGSARLVPMSPYDPEYQRNKDPRPYFLDVPAWTNSKTGQYHEAKRVRVDGTRFYNCHYLIQRNPNIWGKDAYEFDPTRFLDRSGKGTVDELEEAMNVNAVSSTIHDSTRVSKTHESEDEPPHPYHISTLPTGSYRPFERGPRTCIGSNLAYMESKIVLSIMARGFEWTKVGLDGKRPKPGEVEYGGTKKEDIGVGEAKGWKVWSINNVTSVPVDGMRMRLKLRQ